MGNRFSSGKNSIAECDRCGFRFKLTDLRREVVKTKNYELLVCNPCWDPDHPQLQLGMYPVDDPQGVRNPRPDRSYIISGLNGLQTNRNGGVTQAGTGTNEGGSRVFQWGWAPVGGASSFDASLTPNNLALTVSLGTVTVVTT
jgi:hypothetical protein